jgi:carboxyl-terminal processing protease
VSSKTRLIVLAISAPVVAFAVIGGFLGNAMAREDTYQHLRVFEDVVSLILNNYVEEVDLDKVMHGAMHGLADGLDPDSAYLTPEQVRQAESGNGGPAASVGLDLTRQYYLRVIAARDNSPAARAGLLPGDYVRAIDKQPTRDMSVFEGERLLRGPAGSKVTLTVIRGNAAEPHVVELTREVINGPDVSGRMAAPGVGYIRIATFGPRVADRIRTQAAELARAGATRLVIDLRSTASGDLDAGVASARLFVPSGALALVETRGADRQTISAAPGDGSLTPPVALLVNPGTAGPAELFAAALSGNKRAELIGEKTLGRAARQKLVKLPDGSALWLSSSRYLTPSGVAIHEKGLAPDVDVEDADVEFGAPPPASDPALEKAIERLTEKKAA